ncbi:MetS family NSS transporter small subunit [Mechercharimyces sp. CAU 1602]|nr:MetS family NSS transporter small subunit [Mechercharimyces sp. CAU 1602]MCS1351793.1 MetS family NSS transporter small subunit [Mechercharimyces sp. CAU 1602]
MSGGAWIMFLIGALVLWGGFLFFLTSALRTDKKKGRAK